MWKDRMISALLAIAVGAAAGAAVWRFAPEKPEVSDRRISEGVTYEATGVPSGEIVAAVDGNGAEAELFTFWLGSECLNLESYYSIDVASSWDLALGEDSSLKDFVREDVLMVLKQELVLENLTAAYGVTLSDEDEAALAAAREKNVEQSGGEDAYRAELYKLGISEAGYERLSRTDYLYSALYDAYNTPGSALYASDDVLHAYAAGAGYITADHILLLTRDMSTKEPLDDETIAEKRALAEDLLWRLRDSADPVALFKELADEYSEDTGRAYYPDGYTFTTGAMVSEFEDAVYALDENAYSDVVESYYGYHIILRKPLNVAEAVEAVRDEYFDAFFAGEVERAELTLTPAADLLDVVTLYDALKAARNADGADG